MAVLLNKVTLEYLPTYGHRFAEAVRKWGAWVRERATEELSPFYPLEPDGSEPLAYLWARTVRCEGPGCGAEVPLMGLLWLSRKEKQRAALRYWGDQATKTVHFQDISPKSESNVQPLIARRAGGEMERRERGHPRPDAGRPGPRVRLGERLPGGHPTAGGAHPP